MDTIDGMRTVVAVVETGSFTAASERLGISKSLTSKYVNLVEAQLGVKLFHRTTRKLSVNQSGHEYYLQAQQVLTRFDQLHSQIHSANMSASGSLRITASQGFAEEMLSPMIPEFHSCYPDIQIDIIVTNQKLDLVEHGIDIAFRAGQLDDSSFNYRKIVSLQSSVYAAPLLAKQYGDGMELTQLPCLIDSNLHANARWPVDHSFGQDNDRNLAVHAVLKSNSPRLLRQLTLSAIGASYIPDIIAARYVKKGLLQKLDVGFTALKYPLHALYRGGDWQPERVKVFLDFVTTTLGTSN
ncbi:Transcriptional regulator LysR family [Vibrio nigripulchritudo MADA3029]|uniref:LysR family transcriptional regulator n=1 Tax=Vibrio nigripulchritudo TaxID=28173 RepID=UPI0003B22255|nr:LysR family transcriptional regulator [Vibrio nigripulchritudo]CCN38607.1 Transcriptional regulator LysR family [Vibrio nigripulchritudo AM115]CCN44916.1 Transcriptional regulator LysR family [Vibrio nigripulchritudo FTn2]CCN50784.1 Transcriptional regulator LysR family [Vibrio nigripulchritudo MADA3020]CCN56642.1 Transcriptional regulator LysR family [Vibrio nigripulchritudo MADA3021]CCN62499.1 Transcriptional regulator LysR family [Vibrio nigripulchritudo MADA3029]